MLRAIAGYILGGILNDSQEENMECEAREINDWLVVNMPNKPDENDFDLESETGSVVDEDDILSCLSMLMSSEELHYDNSFVDEQKQIAEIPIASFNSQETVMYFPQSEQPICPAEIKKLSFFHPEFHTIATNFFSKNKKRPARNVEHKSEVTVDIKKIVRDIITREKSTRNVKGQERQTQQKEKTADLSSNYIQTPTYVNHRPPITAAKTDLLQQIKDLQPSQRAKDISEKKLITRSNLNKQNKNYIFSSSAKTNRRKDLQRNHSGANNNRNMNRKC